MNGPGAFVLAFLGGLVSFLAPCTLPLLPGYLSYISGLSAEEVQARENTMTLLGAAGLFVLGFSLIFVSLGASLSYIGATIAPHREELTRLSGVFIILLALAMMGVFRVPLLYREKRFHLSRDWGIWSAFPLGMAFAFGWSPCIGPVLTSILAVALSQNSTQRGALLLFVYALGLGVPFLLMAGFAGRALASLRWFKRHVQAINLASGGILLVMGGFLLMNRWTEVMAPFMRWYGQLPLPS